MAPDIPGCFSADNTLVDAIDNAKESIRLGLETVIDDGDAVPEPEPVLEHQKDPDFAAWIWAAVPVDLAQFSDKAERINITLPSRVLRRIDSAAKAAGESRSGFFAKRMLAT